MSIARPHVAAREPGDHLPPTELLTNPHNPPREIADGIWWLASCNTLPISGVPTHLHNSPYLIVGTERTLFWDTGHPDGWGNVARSLDQLLGDRPLDFVIPSHPELVHCANTARLLNRYPDALVVGDVRDYHLYFPQFADRLISRPAGSELDLGGGYRFVFLEALIKDLPSSQWGYEASRQVLFVADALAYSHHGMADGDNPVHLAGECTSTSSELGGPPTADQIVWIANAALYWTRFVQIDRYLEPLEAMLQKYPTRLVAPAHGAVIDNLDTVLPAIWDSLRQAFDPVAGAKQSGRSIYTK